MTVVAADRRPIAARLPVEINTAEHANVRLDLIAVVHAEAHHVTGLIVDLTRAQAVDSAQLRALRTIDGHACDLGIALCVAAPRASVRRLLRLTDIAERTPVFPSLSAALGACSPPSQPSEPRPGGRARQPIATDTTDTTDWIRS
jgi:anti-anti-sigma regulatory factor